MADVPTASPKNAAKGGVNLLKKLPPHVWILIGGLILVIALYMRHKQAQAAQNSNTASADPNQTATDQAAAQQSTTDSYMQGFDAAQSGLTGALGSGVLQSGTGTGQGGVTVTLNGVGGGPPNRPDSHLSKTEWNQAYNTGYKTGFNTEFNKAFNAQWLANQKKKPKKKPAVKR